MSMPRSTLLIARKISVFLLLIGGFVCAPAVNAQCPGPGTTLTGGLQGPTKIIQTPLGNLIVAETGPAIPNSGRVSIVGLDGTRRTLLGGLPSGENSNGDFAGTQGVFLHGRTLYVLNGEGNATLPGPIQGTELPNPNPNSPILSSVLAIHFSAAAEQNTTGYVLTAVDHQALKNGAILKLGNGGGDKITVKLIADFPNFVPDPLPFFQPNVRHSNPFGILGVDDQLYVVDGGRNAVIKVNITDGSFSVLTAFPPIPNPAPVGPPVIEAVPTSIREYQGRLLVTLFRGFPFLSGNADVVSVDPATGSILPFIDGLTSAIDVLPVKKKGTKSFLTLEISVDFLNGLPGRLQRFATPAGPGVPISNCLIGPSNMVRDEKTNTLYITSIFTGQIIQITGQ